MTIYLVNVNQDISAILDMGTKQQLLSFVPLRFTANLRCIGLPSLRGILAAAVGFPVLDLFSHAPWESPSRANIGRGTMQR